MYRAKELEMVDRDALTPLTALSARQALERTIRDMHALEGDVGTLAVDVAQTKQVAMATAEAVAAHLRNEQDRPRMSPAAIKAWLGGTAGILAILVGGLTQWRVAQAGAESRRGAEVAASQAYARQAEQDRPRLAEETSVVTALRVAEEVRRAIREEQAEAERRASMRVAPTRGMR
jgi:hypothetical protein